MKHLKKLDLRHFFAICKKAGLITRLGWIIFNSAIGGMVKLVDSGSCPTSSRCSHRVVGPFIGEGNGHEAEEVPMGTLTSPWPGGNYLGDDAGARVICLAPGLPATGPHLEEAHPDCALFMGSDGEVARLLLQSDLPAGQKAFTSLTATKAAGITARQISSWLGRGDWVAILVGGALVFSVAATHQEWVSALPCAALGALAVAIVVIDLRHLRIPDLLSLPLIGLGLLHTAFTMPIWPKLVPMALVWSMLLLLQEAYRRLRGRAGLGGGDVKLITAAAAWLPPEVLPIYVLAACFTAHAETAIRQYGPRRPFAFGAHLAPWLVAFSLLTMP